MGFQCGDFFVLRGFSLISRGIRLLTSVRYGIPFRETFSHVESAIDEEQNVSAEKSGVKIVSNNREKITKAYAKVYRLKKFDDDDKKNHKEEAVNNHVGKKYAFWRYLLDFIRIVTFICALFWGIVMMLNKFVGLIVLMEIVFFFLIKGFLIKKDKLTEDCAENQSLIYSANGRWFPLPRPRNEFPNGMVQVWENLVLNGVAVVVAERQKGGDWEWKIEEETPESESNPDSD